MKKRLISQENRFLLNSSIAIKTTPHDWQGNKYHNNSTPQFNAAQQLLSTLNFKGNEHILDIGCGSGAITASIAQCIPEGFIYALDSSEDMIKTAQKTYNTFDNLTFFNMDAENFHFEEKFDVITSFSCLHWIKNKQSTLNCISKHLKNNGIFLAVLSLKRNNDIGPLLKTFVEIGLSEKWGKYMNIEPLTAQTLITLLNQQFYPEDEESFGSLLMQSGLKPIQLVSIEKTITFTDKKDFIAWLDAWTGGLSFIAAMNPIERINFITDTVERYTHYVPLNDNKSIEYTEHLLIIQAQK